MSRIVVIHAGLAIKIARGDVGRRCNLLERDIWNQYCVHPATGPHLCPVLWAHDDGNFLVMPAAKQLTADQYEKVLHHAALLDQDEDAWWPYLPGGPSSPWEFKVEDWGLFDGEIVCVDYAKDGVYQ